jgi:hypothetical protein
VTYRRSVTIQSMELVLLISFATGCIGTPPSAIVRIIAPGLPSIISMNVKLPNVLLDLETLASRVAQRCAEIAWDNDLTPFYAQCAKDSANDLPMDPINLFYRRHPELREIAA